MKLWMALTREGCTRSRSSHWYINFVGISVVEGVELHKALDENLGAINQCVETLGFCLRRVGSSLGLAANDAYAETLREANETAEL